MNARRIRYGVQSPDPPLCERLRMATVPGTGMTLAVPVDESCKPPPPISWSPSMSSGYHSTKDLSQRFRCSSRTIFRRMRRAENPFPPPCMRHAGSFNLWDAGEVARWEQRERERTLLTD
jgi:hypothetical protein